VRFDGRRTLGVFALVLAAGVLVASQLPSIWASRVQKLGYHPELVYAGTLPLYLDDATADWAFMRQAKEGRFFFEDPYTADEHPRTYVNLLLWSLGTAARVTGAGEVAVYDGAKWASCGLLLALLYALASKLFEKPGERLVCFALFLLAGGWEGPIAFLQRHAGVTWSASSPSWWMPEIGTLFSMMLFPHMVAGFAAIVGVVLLMLAAWDPVRPPARRTWCALGAGAVLFAVTLFHPYDTITALATVWTAVALIGIAERRWPRGEAMQAAIAMAVAVPAVGYNLYLLKTNPAVAAWDLQNVMRTPPPLDLIMCFGLPLVLALLVIPGFRTLTRPQLMMVAWVVAVAVVIHLPFRFQRRMMGGLQLPLAALACTALAIRVVPFIGRIVQSWPERSDPLGWRPLLLAVALAPLYVETPCYVHQEQWRTLRRLQYPSWLNVEEAAALGRLGTIAPAGAKAIASYAMGNFVPPLSGRTSFYGHGALTMNSKARSADVKRFYAGGPDDDAWRRELLSRWKIDYVLYTPHERALGSFDPGTSEWLEAVFVAGDDPDRRAAIYKVR
jgi:hypothetical protein